MEKRRGENYRREDSRKSKSLNLKSLLNASFQEKGLWSFFQIESVCIKLTVKVPDSESVRIVLFTFLQMQKRMIVTSLP